MKKVKILSLATFALITLVVTSCKKKTDPIPTPIDTAIKDASGNVYTPITIGTQVWLKENLRTSKYNNGDAISNEKTAAWGMLNIGAYCIYDNLSSNDAYGYLYNGYAVTDSRGIAPVGYHVATESDWQKLISSQGGIGSAGPRLKEMGSVHWAAQNTGSNSSGFTALGGGARNGDATANFIVLGTLGYWWSATPAGSNLGAFYISADAVPIGSGQVPKTYGFSVRCVKD